MQANPSTGKGIGIAVLVLSGVYIFFALNASLLGILASPLGVAFWWLFTKLVTKVESPLRRLVIWLFPYDSWMSPAIGRDDPEIEKSITERALGAGALVDKYEDDE